MYSMYYQNEKVNQVYYMQTPVVQDSIVDLFSGGIEGGYYDINDLSTVYQDAAGTIPVTAVGQTIGRVRDKSGNNNHLIQPTVSKQPKLVQDSITGSYGFGWDGIDDFMYAQMPNIVSTSVQMFYSQKFTSLLDGYSYIYLSRSTDFPSSQAGLVLGSDYDDFYSNIRIRTYRDQTSTAFSAGNTALKFVLGSRHVVGQRLLLWNNKVTVEGGTMYASGSLWVNPSPSFILIGKGTRGVTYKALMIGRILTNSEILTINNKFNLDVGAW